MDPDSQSEEMVNPQPGRQPIYLLAKAVLRIRDVYPGSRILIFPHPGSRIQKQQQKRGVKKNLMSYLSM
jgi:hypothetical protein